MNLPNETIKDIAGELELGMECYVHKTTGDLLKFPDRDRWTGDEEEFWQEDVDKLEANSSDYFQIAKMPSHEAFRIMQNFANALKNRLIQQRLLIALEGRKPFASFNNVIHQLEDGKEEWFAFKTMAMEDWVRKQLI